MSQGRHGSGGRHGRRMAPRLSALRDGDLGRLRAALLRRHVARCVECQGVLRELDEQVAALRTLWAPEAAGPGEARPGAKEEAGWLALQQALRAEPEVRARPERRPLRPAFALATAGVACALGLVALRPAALQRLFERPPSDEVLVSLAEAEFRQAELHYQRAIEQLQRVSQRARQGWSADQLRAYEVRLARLRTATERRRQRALQQPADADAQEELYAAYRSEIAFLQDSLRRPPGALPAGLPVSPASLEEAE